VQKVLKERGHEVERRRIELKHAIKQLGSFEVPVRIHPQVSATITVEVVDVEGKVGPGVAVDEGQTLEERALEAAEAVEAVEAADAAASEASDTATDAADAAEGDTET